MTQIAVSFRTYRVTAYVHSKRRVITEMTLPDISFWVFAACVAVFLIGAAWLVKSYRDAKYAQYFFLREEAALRVKRLMFFLVPLAIVIVFLGLRLYGEKEGQVLESGGTPLAIEVTPSATTGAPSPTLPASPTTAMTVTPAVTAQAAAPGATDTAAPMATVQTAAGQTEAPVTAIASPSTAEVTVTATAPVSTSELATPTLTSATAVTATLTPVGMTPTEVVTGTVEPSPTPTVTDTPVSSTVTPGPGIEIKNLVFSRAITPDYKPRSPGTTFSPGENYIYAFFEYQGMQNGVVWRHVWSRGAEQLLSETRLWEWGNYGRAYVFFSPAGGYTPGQYKVQIYVGDVLKQTGEFTIR